MALHARLLRGIYLMKKLTVAFAAFTMMTTSVLAGNVTAVVSEFSGKVLVNKGDGFFPASGIVSLNTGDKVMVGENSLAVISFADCAVSLSDPTVFLISEKAQCSAGSDKMTVISPVAVVADVEVAAAPVFPVPLIFWGVAGVGIIASGVLDDNNDPVSTP